MCNNYIRLFYELWYCFLLQRSVKFKPPYSKLIYKQKKYLNLEICWISTKKIYPLLAFIPTTLGPGEDLLALVPVH